PEAIAGIAFPALMVMTLVENAVEHGVAPVGRGRIAIGAVQEAGRLRITVEDDGRGLVEPLGRGIGLTNLRERLRAVYGESARLELVGREPTGTTATIDIPGAPP
ncbi:MAG: sensor histidine kinase, partial [Terriglobales bacterium]